jgi:glycosyltransferase involved in cell wall biosynthesis
MASGVPVCGTEVGILADLGDPFAVVVSPHDPDELANRTLSLIHDADRYGRQQKLAREYIVSHDADWAAKKYKALFEKWMK